MGTLTIARQKGGWRDRWRAYTIEINGHPVGKVKMGETTMVTLEPGMHDVRLTIDWCSSRTLTVSGDENRVLHCAPGGGAISALSDIVLDTEHYIALASE